MPDKEIIKTSFSRSHSTYHEAARIQRQMAVDLVQQIKKHRNQFDRVLELGVGTGLLTQSLTNQLVVETLYCNDLMDASHLIKTPHQFIIGDAEEITYPDHLDLIVSNAVVQWFDDLPQFFKKAANHLNPEGILAFTSFGPNNFKELRAVTGEGLAYFTLAQLEALIESDFEVVFSRETEVCLKFDSVKTLLKHLKETGVNALGGQRLTKSRYRQLIENYSTKNGSITLTYHPITMIVRKR